jgi:hypothetical protein
MENNNPVPTQCCMPTCALRLLQSILGNNHFYEHLLANMANAPNHKELDAGSFIQNAYFWVDLHVPCIDPWFPIGNIHVDSPIFRDSNGCLFDLSKVNSPSVIDHSKLKPWYETTLRALQQYHVNHDRSGKHDFLTGEGYQAFAHNYVPDSKEMCVLAGAAWHRGDKALKFFFLPDVVLFVDVMMPSE